MASSSRCSFVGFYLVIGFSIGFLFSLSTINSKHTFYPDERKGDVWVNPKAIFSAITTFSQDSYLKPTCSPAKNQLIFAKTHKTGSSTLQNIFLRYAWRHNLTLALPQTGSWMYSFKEPFSIKQVKNQTKPYDFFIYHSVWNYKQVRKLIPKGPSVTILRDPVGTFDSGYVYFGLSKANRMDINQYATKRVFESGVGRNVNSYFGTNQLLWDLGLNTTQFKNLTAIKEKVKELETTMDLVLIAEYFDESLVFLQDQLCWDIQDLTYLKLNERKAEKKTAMTEETRRILAAWMWPDYLLYDHFVDKLKRQMENVPNFQQKLEAFRALNSNVKQDCVLLKGDNSQLSGKNKMALDSVLGYVVNEEKPGCDLYAVSEPNFHKMIKLRQKSNW